LAVIALTGAQHHIGTGHYGRSLNTDTQVVIALRRDVEETLVGAVEIPRLTVGVFPFLLFDVATGSTSIGGQHLATLYAGNHLGSDRLVAPLVAIVAFTLLCREPLTGLAILPAPPAIVGMHRPPLLTGMVDSGRLGNAFSG